MQTPVTIKEYMRRLFVRYAIALIALMFCVFIAFIVLNYRLFIVRDNVDSNRRIAEFIAGQYGTYRQGTADLAADPRVRQALAGTGNVQAINRLLYDFCLGQPVKANFILVDAGGRIVATNLYKSNQLLFASSRPAAEVLAGLTASPQSLYSGVVRLAYDYGQKSDWLFAHAVAYGDDKTGYLLFGLREDSFSEALRQYDADVIVLTDRFNNVFFSTNSLLIDSMGKYHAAAAEKNAATIDQKPYYATDEFSADSGVRVITMTAVAKQQQLSRFGGLFLLGVSVLLILLIRLAAEKLTARNLRSIDELLMAVQACRQGNLDYRIETHTFEEFQTLYDEFRQAMEKLQQAMAHNGELAERKRRMEVKQLESQFNPHFVFNVLEALRYEMLIDPEQAGRMIVSFANLLRYSINYGSTHVLLETDIGYVRDYLQLQKMRYGQRLTYSIAIAEQLLRCKVPKLLIQPIVENSIVHGLEQCRQLTVTIRGSRQDGDLLLCVEDDGPGMSEEKLAALKALLATEDAMPQRIGLYNVHRAAQLLYGGDYGLMLASSSHGMRVMLKIPLLTEEQDV
ncbi:MAG: histidine kinase [Sporomusaceae bacterium]|nr:histidine kinase [Sporomusaceae bacterium]